MIVSPDDPNGAASHGPQIIGRAVTLQVSEGADPQTGEPLVAVLVRLGEDKEQLGIALPLDLADRLIEVLPDAIARSRAREAGNPNEEGPIGPPASTDDEA